MKSQNAYRIRLVLVNLFALLWSIGCATKSQFGPTAVYDQVDPTHQYNYSFANEAPDKAHKLLAMAIAFWQQALPQLRLAVTTEPADATVKVYYNPTSTLATPSHTKLIGCLAGYRWIFDCEIQLQVMKPETLVANLPKFSHFFKQGPLDSMLTSHFAYGDDLGPYLQDKVTLLTIIHEIGHTLGFDHTEALSSQCIMAPTPSGDAHLCRQELAALKEKWRL